MGTNINHRDVALHVEVDGHGPPLLMLHGITSDVGTYGFIVDELATRHRVMRLDFRGHGSSGRAPGNYLAEAYLGDALAVVEALAGEPVLIVGHSLGGMVGAALAQRRPDLVRSVFLEDPAVFPQGFSAEPEGSLFDAFGRIRETVPMLQQMGMSDTEIRALLVAAPAATGTPLGETLSPDALDAMARALLALDATVLDGVVDPAVRARNVPAFEMGRPVEVPGVVLVPDPTAPDGLLSPVDVELLRAVAPHWRFETLAGAGHLMHDASAIRPVYLAHLREWLDAPDNGS